MQLSVNLLLPFALCLLILPSPFRCLHEDCDLFPRIAYTCLYLSFDEVMSITFSFLHFLQEHSKEHSWSQGSHSLGLILLLRIFPQLRLDRDLHCLKSVLTYILLFLRLWVFIGINEKAYHWCLYVPINLFDSSLTLPFPTHLVYMYVIALNFLQLQGGWFYYHFVFSK